MGNFNLFVKLIQDEYKLSSAQLEVVSNRLLADDKEFEKVWKVYKNKTRFHGGIDDFKSVLQDLLN